MTPERISWYERVETDKPTPNNPIGSLFLKWFMPIRAQADVENLHHLRSWNRSWAQLHLVFFLEIAASVIINSAIILWHSWPIQNSKWAGVALKWDLFHKPQPEQGHSGNGWTVSWKRLVSLPSCAVKRCSSFQLVARMGVWGCLVLRRRSSFQTIAS